jgi:hypothetical protein
VQQQQQEHETYERVVTNSVEEEYRNGTVETITVTATYEKGSVFEDHRERTQRMVDATSTVIAVYKIGDDEAELDGFYPETEQSSERLFRENRKSLRALAPTANVVAERVPEEVEVIAPKTTLVGELVHDE